MVLVQPHEASMISFEAHIGELKSSRMIPRGMTANIDIFRIREGVYHIPLAEV